MQAVYTGKVEKSCMMSVADPAGWGRCIPCQRKSSPVTSLLTSYMAVRSNFYSNA